MFNIILLKQLKNIKNNLKLKKNQTFQKHS